MDRWTKSAWTVGSKIVSGSFQRQICYPCVKKLVEFISQIAYDFCWYGLLEVPPPSEWKRFDEDWSLVQKDSPGAMNAAEWSTKIDATCLGEFTLQNECAGMLQQPPVRF